MTARQKNSIRWEKKSTPAELHSLLEILGDEYPLTEGTGKGRLVAFEKRSTGLIVKTNGNKTLISYAKKSDAARGVGILLSVTKRSFELKEGIPFSTFGIMLDCSRNAVMTVNHFKKWLRRLALFGYNMAMLYTEDTYELPGEDYFGYMRGRYTADELMQIDDYAAKLGIEMIGCIQTLGHLAQILRWNHYSDIRDTQAVMLTSEEKTYDLIDKMLNFFSSVFRSRRIHIGMDEAHDLGRGRFMDLNGSKRGFDIFNKHLAKVVEKCGKRGLCPMIWSDMYFRMGSKSQGYYDKKCVIPEDVKEKIPEQVQLVYWDYSEHSEAFFRDWIGRHRDLGYEPVMGSGIYTWSRLWYHHKKTKMSVTPCINACLKENLNELFFTMWGDDGAYCDFDSAFAGLCYVAERCYNNCEPDDDVLEKRFNAICSGSYKAHLLASEMQDNVNASSLLWDDPLLGIFWRNEAKKEKKYWNGILSQYSKLEKSLNRFEAGKAGDIKHAVAIVKALKKKMALRIALDDAYAKSSGSGLNKVRNMIPGTIQAFECLSESFRNEWYKKNKPFGFEVIQMRLAGQISRYKELDKRLESFVDGTVDTIHELDEKEPKPAAINSRYRQLVSGSVIS